MSGPGYFTGPDGIVGKAYLPPTERAHAHDVTAYVDPKTSYGKAAFMRKFLAVDPAGDDTTVVTGRVDESGVLHFDTTPDGDQALSRAGELVTRHQIERAMIDSGWTDESGVLHFDTTPDAKQWSEFFLSGRQNGKAAYAGMPIQVGTLEAFGKLGEAARKATAVFVAFQALSPRIECRQASRYAGLCRHTAVEHARQRQRRTALLRVRRRALRRSKSSTVTGGNTRIRAT